MNKAVFLDRDGVIIEERGNLHKIEDIKIIEDVPEALKILKQNTFILIVISNQPVVARGLITEEGVEEIHKKINSLIKQQSGVELDKFYFCPHHPNADLERYRIFCSCRKPSPGHVIHLESAKKLCDYLIVAVTADEFIISRKGSERPILHEQLRAYMLASMEIVDCVIIQNFEKGTEIIELIKPSFYIKGPDIINLNTPAINEERAMVKKIGGETKYTNDPKWATTEIIDFIANLDN